MACCRENRRARVVREGDGYRARGMGCPQGGDRKGSCAARRDPDDDIVGTDLCVDDGLRSCGLVVLGPFDAATSASKPPAMTKTTRSAGQS